MKAKTVFVVIVCAFSMLYMPLKSEGNVPGKASYQGKLTDEMGMSLDGVYDMHFYIYEVLMGGTFIWNEQQSVVVTDGIYHIQLGAENPLNSSFFSGDEAFLEVAIYHDNMKSWETLTPRQPLTSTAYAFQAENAQALEGYGSAFFALSDHEHWDSSWSGSGVGLTLNSSDNDGLRVWGGSNGVYVGSAIYDGVSVASASDNGLSVGTSGTDALYVNSAGTNGVYVASANQDGVVVSFAGDDGVTVGSAGSPSATMGSLEKNGIEVTGAEGHGLFVGRADMNGITVNSAGSDGLVINAAESDGVVVKSAGSPSTLTPPSSDTSNGIEVHGAEGDGLYIGQADGDGVRVLSADYSGVFVGSAGTGFWASQVESGMIVYSAAKFGFMVESAGIHGVIIGSVGSPSTIFTSTDKNGIYLRGAEGSGLFVGRADKHGVSVESAGVHGVYVKSAGTPTETISSTYQSHGFEVGGAEDHGLYVGRADRNGVHVESAGAMGVFVASAHGDGVNIGSAGDNGIEVGPVGSAGVEVESAGTVGVYVFSAGNPSSTLGSADNNGFQISGAEGHGLYVGRADLSGVYVASAEQYGGYFFSDGDKGRGVYGETDGDNGIGVYGKAMGINATGVWGEGGKWDFYANGSGTNYGPFTGAHEVRFAEDMPIEVWPGMIVSVTGRAEKREKEDGGISLSSTLPTVSTSRKANDKAVFGVLVSENTLEGDHWYEGQEGERFGIVNALGEGRMWVCDFNGPIEAGDFITSSDVPGYGQRQDDDLVHSYTVGKAIETVAWDTVTNTITHDGKQYRRYLIAVVYTSG